MSGDSAEAAMGRPDAEPASGQQVRAEPASGQQDAGQQGTADPASGQEGGAEPASGVAEQAAGRERAVSGTAVGGTAVGSTAAGGTAAGGTAAGGTTPQSPEELSRAGWELPWAESPFSRASPQERAELEVAFATAMRRTGSLMQLMGQAAADRIGINNTDLNCLNILSFSGHMTAGELARATGLTTASITGVIDRLEEAGFVRRERDPHDRRRVVVRLSLDKAVKEVASVFVPMLRDWREMAARYSDDELRLIVDFYGRVEQVFRKHLIRLRDE
jgi:DNA-binding MarR family transcriptional regulator